MPWEKANHRKKSVSTKDPEDVFPPGSKMIFFSVFDAEGREQTLTKYDIFLRNLDTQELKTTSEPKFPMKKPAAISVNFVRFFPSQEE